MPHSKTSEVHRGRGAAPPAGSGRAHWPIVCATLLLSVQRIPLALGRDFDPDELQHVHGGYSIARGATPFEDYFEHHTPWVPVALSVLVRWLGTDWDALLSARVIFACIGVLGIVAVWSLARSVLSRAGASAAALLFTTIVYAVDKGIEIRPDVPAALCSTVALTQAIGALRTDCRRRAAAAGLLIGAAIALTPKAAFVALGIGVGALAHIAARRDDRMRGLGVLTLIVATSTLPLLVTLAHVAIHGYFDSFVDAVILGPLAWEQEIGPRVHLVGAFKRNPLGLGAGLVGLLVVLARALRTRGWDPAHTVLFSTAASISIGWFLVPVPWPQFLLPLWPLIAIGAVVLLDSWVGRSTLALGALALAGAFARSLAETGGAITYENWWMRDALRPAGWLFGACVLGVVSRSAYERSEGDRPIVAIVVMGCAAIVLGGGAWRIQPHTLEYGPLWLLVFGSSVLASGAQRWRTLGLALLVAGPFTILSRQLDERPIAPFRAEFDLVMASTGPDDTVLTGWRGCAVFRPHAYRYFFLHEGVLQALTEEERGPAVLRALRAHPPAAAVRDEGTRGLGGGVQAWLDEHFEPAGVGDVWLRTAD